MLPNDDARKWENDIFEHSENYCETKAVEGKQPPLPNWLEETDRRSIMKLCRLLQTMKDEKQTKDENTENKSSLLEIALKNEITEEFASALIDKEKEVNEQIEKEEEEARLEAI